MARVKRWESRILRLTLRPRMKAGEGQVEYRKRTSKEMRNMKETGPNEGFSTRAAYVRGVALLFFSEDLFL